MKQVTLKIPDNKYSFFLELIKNLGFESVNDTPLNNGTGEHKKIAPLRGKLRLSEEQSKNFHQYVNSSRDEWNRSI